MKALIVEKFGDAVLKNIPLREVGHEELRVRIAYCGVGGQDPLNIVGAVPLPFLPWHLGYQASGIIEEVDNTATARGLKVGDRVALDQYRFCGSCYNCMHDRQTFCENHDYPYGYLDSMMAEYIVVHQRQAWKIPDSVSLEEATLTENLGAALPAIDLAPFNIGDRVMVIGAGACGMLILQLVKLQGGTKITVVEPVETKRKLGLKLGADYVIDPKNQDVVREALKITDGRGYDRVIEASGDAGMIPLTLEMLAQCGKIVLFGIYPGDPKLDLSMEKLWFKEAGIQAVFGQSNLFPRAVDILPKLDLKSMMGPVYPLEQWREAFDAYGTQEHARVLIKCT